MKIHLDLDKDTSIISITIVIALLLLLSIFHGQAQGRCYKKTIITKQLQNSYDQYSLLLKEKYCIPSLDTVKNGSATKSKGSMKKIKKAITSMLISQNRYSTKNNLTSEFCYLPGSNFSNFERYDKNK